MNIRTIQHNNFRSLSIALSCILLFFASACTLTPDSEQVKPKSVKIVGNDYVDGVYVPHWVAAFLYPQMPWHSPPSWMYGQGGGGTSNPKPGDMPGDYHPPSQTAINWLGAGFSAPLPGEGTYLISQFNYTLENNYLSIGLIKASLDGDLPQDASGNYRQFNLLSIDPVSAVAPRFQYRITYNVTVLSSGPGGPLVGAEPNVTVLVTYDFSTKTGDYQ